MLLHPYTENQAPKKVQFLVLVNFDQLSYFPCFYIFRHVGAYQKIPLTMFENHDMVAHS